MTRIRVYGTDFAALQWLRSRPGLDSRRERLSIPDVDLVVHRYRDRTSKNPKYRVDNVMLLETKAHADGPQLGTFAEHDTFGLLNALWNSRVKHHSHGVIRSYPVNFCGERRRVRWWGVHVWAMSGDRPDNSREMWWDQVPSSISVDTLERLIKFEIDPFTFAPVDYRDHHENESAIKPLIRIMVLP
jgi:hypothetical protein